MIKYAVEVHPSGTKHWYLNGEEYTEAEFNKEMARHCASGKVDAQQHIVDA